MLKGTTNSRHRTPGRLTWPTLAIAVGVVAAGLSLAATSAGFTDAADTTSSSVTAGINDVVINGDLSDGQSVKTTLITPAMNFKPNLTLQPTFTVKNAGTIPVSVTFEAPTVTTKDAAGTPPVSPAPTSLAGLVQAALYVKSPTPQKIVGSESVAATGTPDDVKLSKLAYDGAEWIIPPGVTQTLTLTVKTGALPMTVQGYTETLEFTFVAVAAP